MYIKFKNSKFIADYIKQQREKLEAALIFRLEYLVEYLTNHAKSDQIAGYQDRTSNLKSSIGGFVMKDGKPVTYAGFINQAGATEGSQTGLEFINDLIQDYPNGYVLVIVAGMEYATYVENFHNLNVLKKTELEMRKELPKILEKLKLEVKR